MGINKIFKKFLNNYTTLALFKFWNIIFEQKINIYLAVKNSYQAVTFLYQIAHT